MSLENMLSQSQMTTKYMIALIWIIQETQIYKDKKSINGYQRLGRFGEWQLKGMGFLGSNENVLTLIEVMVV